MQSPESFLGFDMDNVSAFGNSEGARVDYQCKQRTTRAQTFVASPLPIKTYSHVDLNAFLPQKYGLIKRTLEKVRTCQHRTTNMDPIPFLSQAGMAQETYLSSQEMGECGTVHNQRKI
jgi:hypothetical protein